MTPLSFKPIVSAMSIEQSVELIAIIHFGIGGVSHIVAPKAWARFFLLLRSKEEAGVIVIAFLSLGFGSVIVAFHRVWSGIPMILTVVGYLQLLKATLYLTYPAWGLRKLRLVPMERAWIFIPPGIVLVIIAALLSYDLFFVQGAVSE